MTHRLLARLRTWGPTAGPYRAILRLTHRDGSAPRPAATGKPRRPAEYGVTMLHKVAPVRSPRTGYRLNLLLPTVEGARTFGGIQTALDVFGAIGGDVAERRIVALAGADGEAGAGFGAYAHVAPGDDTAEPLQFVTLDRPGAPLAVRADDVFVATFWTTAELAARLRRWQAATYGPAPDRFAYLIQDFEPGFYPSSALSELSRATYRDPTATIGIFNTTLLRDHFHESGIRFELEFDFEPRILPELRAAMAEPPVPRSKTIVVYGRPGTPRNAFPAIVDGLRAWRASDPAAGDWTVTSVGQTHPDIDLGGDLALRSIGKLDLGAYAALLRTSAVGISLMISPHPSYPPLEMAHLGMLVLTNRFAGKDLSSWHQNIVSTDDLSAESLAAQLADLCRRFEADPEAGSAGRSLRPDFTATGPQFPFARELAAALASSRGAAPPSPG